MINEGLENIIYNNISRCISEYAKKITEHIEVTKTCKYVNSFLTGAITNTLICWFKNPNDMNINDFSELLTQLLSGVYYKFNQETFI